MAIKGSGPQVGLGAGCGYAVSADRQAGGYLSCLLVVPFLGGSVGTHMQWAAVLGRKGDGKRQNIQER
jgi:hypothetical protein